MPKKTEWDYLADLSDALREFEDIEPEYRKAKAKVARIQKRLRGMIAERKGETPDD